MQKKPKEKRRIDLTQATTPAQEEKIINVLTKRSKLAKVRPDNLRDPCKYRKVEAENGEIKRENTRY